MGTTVLDAGVENRAGLHVYAHCLRGVSNGVAILVLNTSSTESALLKMPVSSNRYTLTAPELTANSVMLNGRPLGLGSNDELPAMAGQAVAGGTLSFAPKSISFLAVPAAENGNCR